MNYRQSPTRATKSDRAKIIIKAASDAMDRHASDAEVKRAIHRALPDATKEEIRAAMMQAVVDITNEDLCGTSGDASDVFATATSVEDLVERMSSIDEALLMRLLTTLLSVPSTAIDIPSAMADQIKMADSHDRQQFEKILECLVRLGVDGTQELLALTNLIIKREESDSIDKLNERERQIKEEIDKLNERERQIKEEIARTDEIERRRKRRRK
jgi:hypothetical protein